MKFRSIAQNLVATFSRKSYLKICLLRMRKFIIHKYGQPLQTSDCGKNRIGEIFNSLSG